MTEKIQLKHPAGKHAVRIDADKYEILRDAILVCLNKKLLTHTELNDSVLAHMKKKKISFEGSIPWYLESVKLHLEAIGMVERVKEGGKLKFKLL